ncbi:hypothetical protein EDD15DRAFT_2357812 [Pisolithus albus]|nr:hypothetical protein EDD15DRAFT_2357812 [Pisolithus albus]
MSPMPLSFSSLLDDQNATVFSSNTLQDSFNTRGNNFPRCSSSQISTSHNTTAPSWNNNPQMSQGSYQQLQHLQETVMKLQVENASLKGERTAIQNAYNALVSQLAVARPDSTTLTEDSSVNVTLQPTPISASPLLNPVPLPPLDQTEYPKVCFWTEKEWKTWCSTTAEGQRASPYTSFLEDKDGNALKADKIGNILQTAREIWHELRSHGFINIDTTWSSMSLTVKKSFRIEIARTHQELNLCEGLWKSDMIGKKNYGSFKQTWFTNRSDAKGGSSKRKVKQDSSESVDDITSKRARLSPSPFVDGRDSSSSDSPSILPSSSESSEASTDGHASNPSAIALPDVSELGPLSHSDSSSLRHTSVNTDEPSQPHDNCDCAEPQTASSIAVESHGIAGTTTVIPTIKNPILSMCRTQPPADTTQTGEGLANDTVANKPSSIAPEPNVHESRSTGLLLDGAGMREDPLDDMARASGQTEAGHMLPAPAHLGQTLQRSGETTSEKQAAPPTVPDKKKTWRPPSNKSARTLCMHRYQKQIGGSLEEFNSYFETLSGEAKAASLIGYLYLGVLLTELWVQKYKDEAKELVSLCACQPSSLSLKKGG